MLSRLEQTRRENAKAHVNKEIYILKETNGYCEICREKWPVDIFCFHHIDPSQKLFSIGQDRWRGGKGPRLSTLEEADKCAILCMNCHALEHKALNRGETLIDDNETYLRYRNKHFSSDKNLCDIDKGFTDRRNKKLQIANKPRTDKGGNGQLCFTHWS